MVDRQLIDWIKSEKAKGISDNQLQKILKEKGWPGEDIDKVVNLTHKGKTNLMPLVTVFALSIIFALIPMLLHESATPLAAVTVLVVFSLIYALVPYYKSAKQENYLGLFILIFTSALFSMMVSSTIFNLTVLIFHLTRFKVTITLIVIISVLTIVFLFYLFYLTLSALSRYCGGYFDQESFFLFKHWPLKMLNVDWEKKWTLVKYPLIVVLIGLIFLSIAFQQEVVQTNRDIQNIASSTQEQLLVQMESTCLNKVFDPQNNSIIEQQQILVIKKSTEIIYPPEEFFDPDTIYFNCDFFKLSCQQKPFDKSRKLEEQFPLKQGYNTILKFKIKNDVSLFSLNDDYQALLSCSTPFTKEQLELNTVQKIEEERKILFRSAFDNVFSNTTWSKWVEDKIDYQLQSIKLGSEFSFYGTATQVIKYEENYLQNGSIDLENHVEQLDKNIEWLYPQFLAIKPRINYESFEYSYIDLISVERSYSYLVAKALRWEDLQLQSHELRQRYVEEKIRLIYDFPEQTESLLNKAIRLKLIETLLIRNIIENNPERRAELIDITQTPKLFFLLGMISSEEL